MSELELTVSAHWVNRWFLVLFARPYARVDGREQPLDWGRPARVPTSPGTHSVTVYLRYRGTRANLGTGRIDVPVAAGKVTAVTAVNGVLNDTPFRPRLADPTPSQAGWTRERRQIRRS